MRIGSRRSRIRHLVLLATASVALSACGQDDDTGQQLASRCGEPGQWSLTRVPSASNGGVIGLVGDHVVSWSSDGDITMLHGSDTCGEGSVDVELDAAGQFVHVDDHVFVLADASAVRFDPASGSTHAAFGAVFPQMHATPAGLLALGIGGKLLLHPNPADPAVEAEVLSEGVAWLPRADDADPPGWPHLWTDGSQTFALSVDFELLRVPLDGSEPVIELEEVEEFHIVDGGRKVLWRGLGGAMLTMTDLGSGEEIFTIEQSTGRWSATEVGRWVLLTTDKGRLLNLDDGSVTEPVDFNPTAITDTGTDNVLLTGIANGSTARGYWLLSPTGTPSTFLAPDACLEFDSQVTADGVIIPEGPCDPNTALFNPRDTMALHPFAGGAPQTLGERFGFDYAALQDGFILSWNERVGTDEGELTADSPAGDPIIMGDGVSRTFPTVDGLDAYFFRLGEGVQRFAISD
ncbi:MAG: hypothetical protein AAF799_12490 [Myxococcota bacterium]